VAAGSARTCALTGSGSVQCWGDNDQGQLGNGTTTNSLFPVNVSGIYVASALNGGYNHNCALLSTGAVQCWGANYSGQLGNGTLTNSSTPVGVSGLYTETTTTVTSGCSTYSCPAGRHCVHPMVACSVGPSYTTTTFTGNAIALGVGNMNDHTCAVISDGTVKCWGDNTLGQLGNGTTTNSSTPVVVTGISTASAVAVGYGHTCALLSDYTVKCWGWNIMGQLGNGTTTDSLVPVAVSGVSDASTISAGFDHSCAVRSGGGVTCWGDNSYTQLGLGVLATSLISPAGINVVSRTTSRGHSYPTCNIAQLAGGSGACVLDGNLIIRAGPFNIVIPLPPD
jgi:alpha-tubulin suppressor-like RCC1 family protein